MNVLQTTSYSEGKTYLKDTKSVLCCLILFVTQQYQEAEGLLQDGISCDFLEHGSAKNI